MARFQDFSDQELQVIGAALIDQYLHKHGIEDMSEAAKKAWLSMSDSLAKETVSVYWSRHSN